jgi:uncharacterized protein
MIALVDQHRDEIANLCREHGITRLAVFGSAVKGTWRPGESDIDVLIDLDYGPGVGRRYMRFSAGLEQLLGAPVDVVTERSVDSQWFRQELKNTAVPIHDAGDAQAIA